MNIFEVVIRLILAAVVGGLIGYEREFKNRPAGFRTHILVCLGAAVTSMIQLYSIQDTVAQIKASPELANALKADIGRLGAQVITGVGFLGAGTIIHEKGNVKGLTTAASIWCVACIGLAAGLGYYVLTILSSLCVFVVLVMLKKFEVRFIDRDKTIRLLIVYRNYANSVQRVIHYCGEKKIKIKNVEFSLEEEETGYISALYTLLVPNGINADALGSELAGSEDIADIRVM